MAKAVGFEPTSRLPTTACFQDKCNKPYSATLSYCTAIVSRCVFAEQGVDSQVKRIENYE